MMGEDITLAFKMRALSNLVSFPSALLGSENQAEIIEESIQHAKEAITLDVKDGNSWCNTRYLTNKSYF